MVMISNITVTHMTKMHVHSPSSSPISLLISLSSISPSLLSISHLVAMVTHLPCRLVQLTR